MFRLIEVRIHARPCNTLPGTHKSENWMCKMNKSEVSKILLYTPGNGAHLEEKNACVNKKMRMMHFECDQINQHLWHNCSLSYFIWGLKTCFFFKVFLIERRPGKWKFILHNKWQKHNFSLLWISHSVRAAWMFIQTNGSRLPTTGDLFWLDIWAEAFITKYPNSHSEALA